MLICARCPPTGALLSAAGVRVISQTCGPVEDVLRGFIAGRLSDGVFDARLLCRPAAMSPRRARFASPPGWSGAPSDAVQKCGWNRTKGDRGIDTRKCKGGTNVL